MQITKDILCGMLDTAMTGPIYPALIDPAMQRAVDMLNYGVEVMTGQTMPTVTITILHSDFNGDHDMLPGTDWKQVFTVPFQEMTLRIIQVTAVLMASGWHCFTSDDGERISAVHKENRKYLTIVSAPKINKETPANAQSTN